VGGGDVKENEFVSAFGVVDASLFDRVAGIDEVDEVDAFDDASVVDI
jgi:hypothetical protein